MLGVPITQLKSEAPAILAGECSCMGWEVKIPHRSADQEADLGN